MGLAVVASLLDETRNESPYHVGERDSPDTITSDLVPELVNLDELQLIRAPAPGDSNIVVQLSEVINQPSRRVC